MPSSLVCSVNNLKKSHKSQILRSVSFELRGGEGLVVYGHNGSGKTTLLDILAGIQPSGGGSYKIETTIGYVMQRNGFMEKFSCLDNLRLEAALCGLKKEAAKAAIERCSADCGLSSLLKKRVSKCSAGMRARLAIAMALLPAPGLLLMDEAFSALDEESCVYVRNALISRKRDGMGIIMVTHNMGDCADLCERILKLPSEEVTCL